MADARLEVKEAKIIEPVINHPQNTHGAAISSGVGMALLQLSEQFLSAEVTEEALYEHWVARLRASPQAAQDALLQQSIDFLIQKMQEPVGEHDEVPLLRTVVGEIPERFEMERHVFPLKKVFALVFCAIHDPAGFVAHYVNANTPFEAAMMQAKEELPQRLESFFNCLKRLKQNPVCHLGIRHELVCLLNKTYKGIDLIEYDKASILSVLNERLNTRFWTLFQQEQSAKEKQHLLQALFIWINDNNPRALCALVDPQKKMEAELHALFLRNGVDPQYIRLEKKIQEALPQLEFSCDPKKYPLLAKVKLILSATEVKGQETLNQRLDTIQTWIKTECFLDNEEDVKEIELFYTLYSAQQQLSQSRFLLELSESMTDELLALQGQLTAFFNAMAGGDVDEPSQMMLEACTTLNQAVARAQKETLYNEIENFLAHWFTGHLDERKRLYAMLSDPEIKSKIILSDKDLQKITQENTQEDGSIQITPYLINRVFLHAILQEPEKWTFLFKQCFAQVLAFVNNHFNQAPDQVAPASLLASSYPEELRAQLNALKSCAFGEEEKEDGPRQEVPRVILLPHQCRTIEELILVAPLLNSQQKRELYTSKRVGVDSLILKKLEEMLRSVVPNAGLGLGHPAWMPRQQLWDLFKSFFEDWEPMFTLCCKQKVRDLVQHFDHLALLVGLFPEEQWAPFLKRFGFKDGSMLVLFLGRIDEGQRPVFLETFGMEHIVPLIQEATLNCFVVFLAFLAEGGRFQFLKDFGIASVSSKISDSGGLFKVLDCLLLEERLKFLQDLGTVKLRQLINSFGALKSLLQRMDSAFTISIDPCREILGYFDQETLHSWFQETDHLHLLCYWPTDQKIHFLQGFTTEQLQGLFPDWQSVLRHTPTRDWEFKMLRLFPVAQQRSWITDWAMLLGLVMSAPSEERAQFLKDLGFEKLQQLVQENPIMLNPLLMDLPAQERYPVLEGFGAQQVGAWMRDESALLPQILISVRNWIDCPIILQNLKHLDKRTLYQTIPNVHRFADILRRLDPAQAMELLEAYGRDRVCVQIDHIQLLSVFLDALPMAERYAFLMDFGIERVRKLAPAALHLLLLVRLLPPDNRCAFLQDFGWEQAQSLLQESEYANGEILKLLPQHSLVSSASEEKGEGPAVLPWAAFFTTKERVKAPDDQGAGENLEADDFLAEAAWSTDSENSC